MRTLVLRCEFQSLYVCACAQGEESDVTASPNCICDIRSFNVTLNPLLVSCLVSVTRRMSYRTLGDRMQQGARIINCQF